jgi:hypothetical protein
MMLSPLTLAINRLGSIGAVPLLTATHLYSGITYTQSGNFDSTGVLQTAAVDTMVREYDPVTLAFKGYPFRVARTNVVLHNRDFTNVAWVATDITPVKTATGITGVANSASTLTATAGNGTILQSITLASSARFQTCYIKRRTGTGTIEMTMDNGATWAAVTVTAAWTRVSIPTQTLANPIVGFRIVTSGDAVDVDFFQNENGIFATNPIPTTTAAVARAAPSGIVSGANFSGWYNQTQGTLIAEFMIDGDATSKGIVTLGDGTANERMLINTQTAKIGTSFRIVDGGVDQGEIDRSGVFVDGQVLKVAIRYGANNFAVSYNGGAVGTDTSGTLPAPSALYLASNGAGTPADVYLRSLSYYAAALPNATLQSLATV